MIWTIGSVVAMSVVCDACQRIIGRRPSAPTPDAIASLLHVADWKSAGGWESKTDVDVAKSVGLYEVGLGGSLVVVTEASFMKSRGAFKMEASELPAFVAQHLAQYGECFFNGDVIVAELGGNRLWLFHHEGQYAMVAGDSSIASTATASS